MYLFCETNWIQSSKVNFHSFKYKYKRKSNCLRIDYVMSERSFCDESWLFGIGMTDPASGPCISDP